VTPQELADLAVEVVREAGVAEVTTAAAYSLVTVDVLRDGLGLDSLDVVTAVDAEVAGFDVVVHAFSTTHKHGLALRTRIPREDPSVTTLTGVWAGAAWHERHTAELFGIGFEGHPGLTRLLLPDHVTSPLRKDVLLERRQTTPWPGRKEPGESETDSPRRRRLLPPGVAP
jgi:NADH-quinone oxidoreductase subunit C